MATGSPALPVSAAPTTSRRWRVELVEFLVVGGATLVLLPLAWLARAVVGLDAAELAVGFLGFHAAYVINDPHFAVTYLLFYKHARRRAFGEAFGGAQRVRYLVAGLVVPLVLVAWAIVAMRSRSARSLGWMFQLMFFLVRWHYVKQGFGVLAVLSARRGVVVGPVERGALLTHCFAAWAFAWASPATVSVESEEKGVVYTSLAHPYPLALATQLVFAASTAWLVWVLAKKWLVERKTLPLAPLGGFLITVWLWTVFSRLDPLLIYVIPALHSVQYLYFVWLLKRNQAREEEGPPSFGLPVGTRLALLAASAVVLGVVLFHGAPAFLDGLLVGRAQQMGDLGVTPYFAAAFAVVNIHHYFMDHVIWRRENGEMRYLREP